MFKLYNILQLVIHKILFYFFSGCKEIFIQVNKMPPDSRSVSFVFHRDTVNGGNSPDDGRPKNFRRRLQDKFDKEQVDGSKKSGEKDATDRPWHNLSLGQVSTDSKRALRNGADKISKTISSVRTTFGSISQVRIFLYYIFYYNNK